MRPVKKRLAFLSRMGKNEGSPPSLGLRTARCLPFFMPRKSRMYNSFKETTSANLSRATSGGTYATVVVMKHCDTSFGLTSCSFKIKPYVASSARVVFLKITSHMTWHGLHSLYVLFVKGHQKGSDNMIILDFFLKREFHRSLP